MNLKRILLLRAVALPLAALALWSAAHAAQVQDSVLDDVMREFSLDKSTPADMGPFLIAPTQGASYPQPGPPPVPPQPAPPPPAAPAPAPQPAPTCGQMLPYYGMQAGLGSVCTCPGGDFSSTQAPSCTCADGSAGPICSTPCQINLPAAQAAAGPGQTCSCPPPTTSPVQTVEPLSTYTSSGWISAAFWPDASASWIFGTSPNTVRDGVTQVLNNTLTNSGTSNISATLYLAADDAASVTLDGVQIGYYSDQGTLGSAQYPSTGGVTSFPVTITPGVHNVQMAVTNYCKICGGSETPAAGLMSIIDSSGNVLLHSDGSWTYTVSNGSPTPTCQVNCGGMLATMPQYQTNANQVCSCANSTAVAVPTCQPTCGSQLAAAQEAAGSGSVCSCPSGDGNVGTPVCTQTCGSLLGSADYPSSNCSCPGGANSLTKPVCAQTCGTLLSSFQSSSGPNQTCSCPNGADSYSNPVCAANCRGKIATLQGQMGNGYVCTCTNPDSTTETPTCAQTCGSQLAIYQAKAGANQTCSCPNGNNAAGLPVCKPSCDSLLADYQAQYGPNYVCSCPGGPTSTDSPVCQMTCGGLMLTNTTYQTSANQICSCPNGPDAVGAPQCTLTCQGQLSSTQNSLGSGYTCSCPTLGNGVSDSKGVVWAPVEYTGSSNPASVNCATTNLVTQTCAYWFPAAQWPDYGAQWIYGTANNLVQNGATETMRTTWTNSGTTAIAATLYLALDDYGSVSIDGVEVASYSTDKGGITKTPVLLSPGPHTISLTVTNTCPNCTPTGNPSAALLSVISDSGKVLFHTDSSWTYAQSQTDGPTCQVNCGGYMQYSPIYQSNADQVCSCPSGANAVTTPTCVPTCGSKISAAQAQAGPNYVCSCPNGNTSTGSPTCSLTCEGMMATMAQYQTNANQVCSCPSGSNTPVCQPTCGAQLPAIQNSYGSGYVCSCPGGNTNTGSPTCSLTCGGMLATQAQYQSNANQVCSCPSGDTSTSPPTCQPTCGAKLASAQSSAGAGYTCSCPSGASSLSAPSCVQTGNMLWTKAFAGQYGVYQYPAMYWISVDFNPDGSLAFHDVSGEGYGAPAPTSPSSCNATVQAPFPGGYVYMNLTPLYANATDQANCAKPTGYVIYKYYTFSSCQISDDEWGLCQKPSCDTDYYQYGYGVNASALAQYCPGQSSF